MANKMTAKISATIANLFGDKPEEKSVKVILDEARDREKQLMSKMEVLLDEIQYNPRIRLPKEKIKEFKIENRVARMRKALETPLITKIDTVELDKLILSFADSLKLALEQGYEHGANWASMALLKTVETLRIDTPDLYARDPEMEKALYAQKLNYANNFYHLIQQAIERDRKQSQMADMEKDYHNKLEEMRNRETAYRALMKTESGIKLIAAANAKKTSPASLTNEEKAILDNEKRIASLRDNMKSINSVWETLDTELNIIAKQMAAIQTRLLSDPEVHDEKLAAKIKVAGEIFIDSLNKRLDEARIMASDYDEYNEKMAQLLNHPANRDKYAKIAQAISDMENEWLTRAQAEQDAHRIAIRKAQNVGMIEAQVEKLQQDVQELLYEVEQQRQEQLNKAMEEQHEDQFEEEPEKEYETEIDI